MRSSIWRCSSPLAGSILYTAIGSSLGAGRPSQWPRMPNSGSVNQIEPSRAQTMSLGELSRLPSKRSASTVMLPSYSVRVTRRVRCSQLTRRPCMSRAWPLAWLDGQRSTLVCPEHSSQRRMRLFGMSLTSR